MKKKFYLLLLVLFSVTAYAQIDTEFWFAAPQLYGSHYRDSVAFSFISFEHATTVTVMQPANPQFEPVTLQLGSYDFKEFSLKELNKKAMLETLDGIALPYGFQIISDNPISAYYTAYGNSSEIYTLKGRSGLGKEFLVPGQFTHPNKKYPGVSTIEVVATEDNTVVVITPTRPIATPSLLVDGKVTTTLNRGQSFAVKALGQEPDDNLRNSTVVANKPIAVNTSDDAVTDGNAVDLVGDQLVPNDLLGTRYIAVKNKGAEGVEGRVESLFIFPTKNNTEVYINGVSYGVMNVGQERMFSFTEGVESALINSNHPISVFQMSSVGGELGGSPLPTIDCTGSMEVAYKRMFRTATSVILVKTAYINDFLVNGQTGILNASDFFELPADNSWSYAHKVLPINENGVTRIKNNLGYFHFSVLDGENLAKCSYGYFSGFHKLYIKASSNATHYITGGSAVLSILNAEAFSDIVWVRPDGTTFNGNPLIVDNLTEADAGLYMVDASSNEGCVVGEAGSVVINLFDSEEMELYVCNDDEVVIPSRGYAPFEVTPGDILSFDSDIVVSPEESTTYEVTNRQEGKNTVPNGNFSRFNHSFSSELLYGGTNANAISTAGYYSVWRVARDVNSNYNRVYDHTTGSSSEGAMLIANLDGSAGKKIWRKTIEVIPNTRYKFSAWFITPTTSGPQANLDFVINDHSEGKRIIPPYTRTVSNPLLWKNDSCFWDSGNRTQVTISIVTNASEAAPVCIDDVEFIPYLPVTDNVRVHVVEAPTPVITGEDVICKGAAILDAGGFDNGDNYSSYAWSKEGSSDVIGNGRILTVTAPGTYIVEAGNGVCTRTDRFDVAAGEQLKIDVDPRVSVCPGEPNVSLNYLSDEGKPLFFDVIYDARALAAGFSHSMNVEVTDDQILTIDLPHNPQTGTYYADLIVTGSSVCEPVARVGVELQIKTSGANFIGQKWNNVLALYNESYNGGEKIVAYQWYKNGVPLDGATRSYIYLGEGETLDPDDRYAALLTREDGSEYLTCDFFPETREADPTFPNAVKAGQMIHIPGMSGEATFWDIGGVRHSAQSFIDGIVEIKAPEKRGWYVLELKTEDRHHKFKLVVQ